MSSSNKTAHLKLNLWSGTDKPKREDFNSDNQKTEDAFNSLQKISSGTYVGDGKASRSFTLGFQPSAVFITAVGLPCMEAQPDGGVILRSCMAAGQLESFGAGVTSTGFRVFDDSHQNETLTKAELNAQAASYFYVVYR